MAFSFEFFNGDGANRDFAVNKPYIDRSHVTVEVNGVSASFVWINASLVRMDVAPAAGTSNVKVLRTTPISEALVNFINGSTLDEADLDLVATQLLYINQEGQDNLSTAADAAANALASEIASAASAAAAAASEGNAATSESNASASAVAASGSAGAAAASAGNATTSETNAGTSETNAAGSAAAAATSAGNAATSETNAAGSESAAAASAGNAATSASNAATSESNAAGSAGAAATSESNAATSEANAASSAVDASSFALLNTTSTSSVTIGTSLKQFVTADERAFTLGQFVKISHALSPATQYMWGQVTSWSPSINTLIVNVEFTEGSGTFGNWIIAGTGARGEDGVVGAGISPQGAYDAGTSYSIDDGVTFNGSFWRSLQNSNLGNTPDVSPAFWEQTVSQGDAGAPGADGSTVLNGTGAPGGGLGADGDFYIDTAADDIYGPKTGGAWGGPTSLIGPQGPAGGLANVVEDLTPQLGGELDGQGNAAVDVSYDVVAAETASFTFSAAQAGRLVPCNSGAAMNATVPANATTAFAVGTTLAIWNQGAGAVTWVASGGVTLNQDASLTLVSNGQHAVSFAVKVATNTWVVSGGLAAA